MLSVADIYSLRFGPKLPLPKIIQENIAKLRISPAHYKPVRPPMRFHKKHNPVDNSNWREKLLVDIVRRVREREDPEYSDIFAIFNKITKSTVEKLSNDTATLIQKRDETFRLRVSTLLFDKATTNHTYSAVMADCALILSKVIPEIIEDLDTQMNMFETLYNMNETILCSEETIVEWTKQKEKRKGFAKFVMELFVRNLVSETIVQKGLADVIAELTTLTGLSKSEQNDENIHQFVVFLYETAKLVPSTNNTLREYIRNSIITILASSKLQMKTKFKMEDALKLVS